MEIPKNPWQGTSDDLLKKLATNRGGLTDLEAQKRLLENGPNSISRQTPIPLLKIFLDQFLDLLVLMLIFACVLSFMLGDLRNGVVIGLIVVLNAIIGFVQEYKAEKILKALVKLLPEKVKVKRNGEEKEISAEYLALGDIVVINEGDKIPADIRVIESYELRINEQILTGEVNPQNKEAKDYKDGNLLITERLNLLFAGTNAADGEAIGVVVATGRATEFGKIAQKTMQINKEHSPLQEKTRQVAKKIAIFAAIWMIVLIFYHFYFVSSKIVDALIFAVVVAAALVPEGLPATVSVALSFGARNLARNKALIKNLVSVETLGSTTVICTDKTGTLTTGKMTVREVWEFANPEINPAEKKQLIRQVAILCNDAEVETDNAVGDPTEIALLEWAKKEGVDVAEYRKKYLKIDELPFNSRRRFMSTTYNLNGNKFNCVKGAPEIIAEKCHLNDEEKSQINKKMEEYASEGYRVLALAYNHIFLGLVSIFDPPRPEVKEAIENCKKGGIRVIMVTGDNPLTAASIGKITGITYDSFPEVIDGKSLSKMSDLELRQKLHHVNIFARILPEQKFRIVDNLMSMGEIVAATGDGVNDAPALKKADIGIAMGITGTDVSKQAADLILLDDNFATIVKAVVEGRVIFDNVKRFLFYIFTHNFGELMIVALGIFFGLPLTMLPVQILAVDLGTDILPSMSFIAEKEENVMSSKPRSKSVQLLNLESFIHLSLLGTVVGFGAIWNFTSVLNTTGNYAAATTVSLSTLAVAQAFNAFLARCPHVSIFKYSFWSNKYLIGSVLISLIILLLIVYTEPLNNFILTSPFPAVYWLRILLVGIVFLIVEELYKLIKKKHARV
ncbi:TPA: ATPase [Candidatus Berkelbacteria bacterium]|uniref:P-type HAD superfamily ATPase n=1 Tax=Berkelbacteria bacterium GW2011_GWE1_39_12 TaxID=1618337 RepID=A0A0G4B3N5_9BACT|nr:MAG: P-type HAD superfamily ATPase [Berkelbacteria bacterium GW2011_GWE1_39_12]HBO61051.1 ATPase [Candidatus Berkelbacteria bacterium]